MNDILNDFLVIATRERVCPKCKNYITVIEYSYGTVIIGCDNPRHPSLSFLGRTCDEDTSRVIKMVENNFPLHTCKFILLDGLGSICSICGKWENDTI